MSQFKNAKKSLITLVMICCCRALFAQALTGTWSILDGAVVVNFMPDGKLLWELPAMTIAPSDSLESHYESRYEINGDNITFSTPDNGDTLIAKYVLMKDSLVILGPADALWTLYKTNTGKQPPDQKKVEEFLVQHKSFRWLDYDDTIETSFVGNKFFEDGEEMGTWTTFLFYGNLFLLYDYGDDYLDFYHIRELGENSISLSQPDFNEGSEDDFTTYTIYVTMWAE